MPVKARFAKSRYAVLTIHEWHSLTLGEDPERPVFANEAERRMCWEEHRARLVAGINSGHRPEAWWDYDSPAPRDPAVKECLQLYRLGVLEGEELDECVTLWRQWEEKASSGLHYTAGPDECFEGADAYHAWRRWAGIPSELFPPVWPEEHRACP